MYCFKCEKVTVWSLRNTNQKGHMYCSKCGIYDWFNEELKRKENTNSPTNA